MNFKNIIYLLAISIILFNCSSSSSDDLTPTPDPDPDPTPTTITYNNTIKNLMSNNCTNCHGNPPTNNAPISFTTYTQVKNNIDNIINRTNNSGNPMPPTGLMSSGNRDLLQQWKDDGLLDN